MGVLDAGPIHLARLAMSTGTPIASHVERMKQMRNATARLCGTLSIHSSRITCAPMFRADVCRCQTGKWVPMHAMHGLRSRMQRPPIQDATHLTRLLAHVPFPRCGMLASCGPPGRAIAGLASSLGNASCHATSIKGALEATHATNMGFVWGREAGSGPGRVTWCLGPRADSGKKHTNK